MEFPNSFAHSIQVVQTCRALAERGADVALYVRRRAASSDAAALSYYGVAPHRRLSIRQFAVTRLRPSGKWRGIFFRLALRRLCAAHAGQGPERACVMIREPEIARRCLPVARRYRVPVFLEVHRGSLFGAPTSQGQDLPKRRREREQERAIYAAAAGIICITRAHRDSLVQQEGIAAPIETIPDAADLDVPRAAARDLDVIYAGQLYPWKGVGTAVAAMQHLPEYRLTIVGGNDHEQLKRLREQAVTCGVDGRVAFAGHVAPPMVKEYLARARAGVVPLPSEGYPKARQFTSPLKLFEYMAAGVPTVASDLPSTREVLRDGENAILVAPDDPRALAEGVRRVLADPRLARRLADNALRDVQQFSWRRRAERILAFMASVLNASD